MGQLPNLNEFMRISRRILAGLATASLAVTVTSCGGGSDTSGSFDDTVTVGILHSFQEQWPYLNQLLLILKKWQLQK